MRGMSLRFEGLSQPIKAERIVAPAGTGDVQDQPVVLTSRCQAPLMVLVPLDMMSGQSAVPAAETHSIEVTHSCQGVDAFLAF